MEEVFMAGLGMCYDGQAAERVRCEGSMIEIGLLKLSGIASSSTWFQTMDSVITWLHNVLEEVVRMMELTSAMRNTKLASQYCIGEKGNIVQVTLTIVADPLYRGS